MLLSCCTCVHMSSGDLLSISEGQEPGMGLFDGERIKGALCDQEEWNSRNGGERQTVGTRVKPSTTTGSSSKSTFPFSPSFGCPQTTRVLTSLSMTEPTSVHGSFGNGAAQARFRHYSCHFAKYDTEVTESLTTHTMVDFA